MTVNEKLRSLVFYSFQPPQANPGRADGFGDSARLLRPGLGCEQQSITLPRSKLLLLTTPLLLLHLLLLLRYLVGHLIATSHHLSLAPMAT